MNKWYQVLSMLKHVSVILLIYFNVFSLDFNTTDTPLAENRVFLLTYLHHGEMR